MQAFFKRIHFLNIIGKILTPSFRVVEATRKHDGRCPSRKNKHKIYDLERLGASYDGQNISTNNMESMLAMTLNKLLLLINLTLMQKLLKWYIPE